MPYYQHLFYPRKNLFHSVTTVDVYKDLHYNIHFSNIIFRVILVCEKALLQPPIPLTLIDEDVLQGTEDLLMMS